MGEPEDSKWVAKWLQDVRPCTDLLSASHPPIGGIMSTMAALASPQKINFAEMRETGARGLLVYCADYRCSHSIAVSAERWPDEVQLSDIGPRFTRTGRGNLRRMDVRCRRLRRSQSIESAGWLTRAFRASWPIATYCAAKVLGR
jgi:hypothetical protein